MNRRAKASLNQVRGEGYPRTMGLTQPCSLQRASPLVQLQRGMEEPFITPKHRENPFMCTGKDPFPPERELKPSSRVTAPAHPPAALPEQQLHRDQQRHGTGTIFRPVLTMTSGKRSSTEPFAYAAGTVGTRTPAATRPCHHHSWESAAAVSPPQGSSEPPTGHTGYPKGCHEQVPMSTGLSRGNICSF